MAIITISRQLGSQGDKIAELIAQQLGYKVVSRQLINQAALQACAPEIALAEIDELGLLGISPSDKDCKSYVKYLKKIIHNLAETDRVVIVGRGSQIILQDFPDTLHIRVIAPLKIRISRVMEEQSISHDAAAAQIKASDRSRDKFFKRFFDAKLSSPYFYDLVLNTGHINSEAATRIIQTALHQKSPLVSLTSLHKEL